MSTKKFFYSLVLGSAIGVLLAVMWTTPIIGYYTPDDRCVAIEKENELRPCVSTTQYYEKVIVDQSVTYKDLQNWKKKK